MNTSIVNIFSKVISYKFPQEFNIDLMVAEAVGEKIDNPPLPKLQINVNRPSLFDCSVFMPTIRSSKITFFRSFKVTLCDIDLPLVEYRVLFENIFEYFLSFREEAYPAKALDEDVVPLYLSLHCYFDIQRVKTFWGKNNFVTSVSLASGESSVSKMELKLMDSVSSACAGLVKQLKTA
jgi:hypothetical protein